MSTRLTYGRLDRLLTGLRFRMIVERARGVRAYRHGSTQTLLLLADRPASALVAEADLASIRRHLSENGILEAEAFEAWRTAA